MLQLLITGATIIMRARELKRSSSCRSKEKYSRLAEGLKYYPHDTQKSFRHLFFVSKRKKKKKKSEKKFIVSTCRGVLIHLLFHYGCKSLWV